MANLERKPMGSTSGSDFPLKERPGGFRCLCCVEADLSLGVEQHFHFPWGPARLLPWPSLLLRWDGIARNVGRWFRGSRKVVVRTRAEEEVIAVVVPNMDETEIEACLGSTTTAGDGHCNN